MACVRGYLFLGTLNYYISWASLGIGNHRQTPPWTNPTPFSTVFSNTSNSVPVKRETMKLSYREWLHRSRRFLPMNETLVAATKNFNAIHKLGEGGFGPVYKGKLNDGREVAVKKLSHTSNQGRKEFMNEAKLLARVQHRNVVNLLGYCVHDTEKLLVYEYVPHESLDKLLFSF